MTPGSPCNSILCVQMEFPVATRSPRVTSQEKHKEVKEFISLLHFPRISIPLPAEKQDLGPLTCPIYVQRRRLTSLLQYAALPVPLIKREKQDLTNPGYTLPATARTTVLSQIPRVSIVAQLRALAAWGLVSAHSTSHSGTD